LLGRFVSSTLELRDEPPLGLGFRLHPPSTELGHETVSLVERRDLRRMSFAFTVAAESWYEVDGELPLRLVEEVEDLYDVSGVTYAAYPTSSIYVEGPQQRAAATRAHMLAADLARTGGVLAVAGASLAPPT